MKYTEMNTFRSTKKQKQTLRKMKSLNVDVGNFIREAIKEKLNRDKRYFEFNFNKNKSKSSFEKQLENALSD